MLIIPGGRVKLIDFDTNKVCLGHCEYINCSFLVKQKPKIPNLTL